jgi:AAT family amino acid transporter
MSNIVVYSTKPMPDLQAAFFTGVPLLIAPMIWYKLRARRRAALAR